MGKAIYRINLDMQSAVSQATLYAKQGDTNRQIHIIFSDGSLPYEISENDLLVLSTKTPAGKTIEESVSVIGGEAVYDFSSELTASIGTMEVEVRLYKSGELIISPTFTLVVEARIDTADDVVTQDSFTELDNVYKGVSALKDGLDEVIERAESAASDAESAAESANDAAKAAAKAEIKADEAAGKADNAAINAELATKRASAATDKIDTYKTIRREEELEGGDKIFSEMRLEPTEAHFEQGIDYGDRVDSSDFIVKDGEVRLYRNYNGEELPLKLIGVATPDGSDPTQAANVEYVNKSIENKSTMYKQYGADVYSWFSATKSGAEAGSLFGELAETKMRIGDGEVVLEKYNMASPEDKFVALKGISTPDGSEPTQAVNVQYLKGRSGEVDPVFANNSWELIKWVCQHDDPSKYWRVGDYKMLSFGEDKYIGANLETKFIDIYGAPFLQGNISYQMLIFDDWDLFCSTIGNKEGTYTIKSSEGGISINPYTIFNESGEIVWTGNYSELHLSFSDVTGYAEEWTLVITKEENKYPLQIIGFNHDKVIDPYTYGKQKAGMTLQLGCSRNIYGDTKPSLFNGKIDGLMTAKGYFYSPTRVKADYTLGATNWADGGFRVALQNMFAGTEIEPYMVEVQKFTSQYFNENNRWAAPMLTNDKVFLLSEWELFGMQVFAPYQEGEQYEFYKDGYSKFMWREDMLNNGVDLALLWSRSAQKDQVNANTKDSISACCCYLTVNSREPLSVNYSPSAAGNVSEARAGLIAPCICL